MRSSIFFSFFFFNDTATTEIYTPFPTRRSSDLDRFSTIAGRKLLEDVQNVDFHSAFSSADRDRKSTRLNSSHGYISYAVFCLKKKKLIPRCIMSHLRIMTRQPLYTIVYIETNIR